jgi:hypothetical protein
MQLTKSILAEAATDTAEQIGEIYQQFNWLPDRGLQLMWVLIIVIAMAVIAIFLRQKEIAKNQVNLAKLIERLVDKE